MRLMVLSAALLSAVSAHAATTVPTGQPFCTTIDNLHEYVLAALNKDRQWLNQIDGCAMVKGGLKMEVIDKGDATAGMHVDKVRIFGAHGSALGYTVNIDP